MYLSKVEIVGFKSFPIKTDLKFTDGLTAVVGPNGCGKSNLVEALRWRDYPIVQNLVMFIACVVVFTNFVVDLLYAAIDPRIRFGD